MGKLEPLDGLAGSLKYFLTFKTKMNFEPNAIYHIYNRSNETIFYSKENYIFFLNKIKKLVYPVCNILAWVLMPNHFHLLIEATEKSCSIVSEKHRPDLQLLAKNIGTLLSSYTQAINKQEGRRESLFAHKTKAKMLNEEYYPSSGSNRLTGNQADYATVCFLYIHQNPVIAGLVSQLEDWEFSSFRDYANIRNGKLTQKELAYQIIELDFDSFKEQSDFLVQEELQKKLF